MNTTPDIEQLKAKLRQEAEAIVQDGAEIRKRTARLASGAASLFHETREGLLGIANAVIQGAVTAADKAVPEKADGSLRAVAEGLADGFAMAAEAVDLTVRESHAAGRRFAEEDLQKARADLRAVSELFAEAMGGIARGLRSQGASQASAVADHARITFERARPILASALRTLSEDTVKIGGEAGRAGAAAARAAAGTLFRKIGTRLTRLGQGLTDT